LRNGALAGEESGYMAEGRKSKVRVWVRNYTGRERDAEQFVGDCDTMFDAQMAVSDLRAKLLPGWRLRERVEPVPADAPEPTDA
jgi:hypothetical protein